MKEVIKVAEKLFERNRFDFNLADSDSDLPDFGEESDSSGEETESEKSDDEEEEKLSPVKKQKKKKRSTPPRSPDSEE
jgi:hypothetical protein